MKRWKVYKDHEDRAWRWIAAPAHKNWWERPQGRRFPQWDMALRYADEQAQPTPNAITIEDRSGALCDLTATVTDQGYIRLKAGDDAFILVTHEWKPLAGFLLDVAKYKEEA